MVLKPKYAWYCALGISGLLTFFNVFSWPHDFGAAMNWLNSIDEAVFRPAAHPTMFAIVVGLALGTILLPEIWNVVRDHISPPDYDADLDAIPAFKLILRQSKWAKREEKRQYEKASEKKVNKADARALVDQMVRINLAQEFHHRMKKGKLHAWGCTRHDRPEDHIDRQEWENMYIDFSEETLRDQAHNAVAWLANGRALDGTRIKFILIRFSKKQLIRQFPLALIPRKVRTNAKEKAAAV